MQPSASIQQLRYFVAVATAKSFNAAADLMSRSQPAVWLAIQQLETQLGQTLFIRGRNVEMTAFGRECYPQAVDLINHYERVMTGLSLRATAQVGRVAIACVPSFASQRLPAIIESFLGAYPDIQIEIEDNTAQQVREQVMRQKVDFGIGSPTASDDGLEFTPLLLDEIGVVVPKDHPLTNQKLPVQWEDLRNYGLINNGSLQLLDGTAAKKYVAHAHLFVSNIISLMAMLRAGLGITTLPKLSIASQNMDVIYLPLTNPCVTREIGILTPAQQLLSPAAQSLAQHVRQHMHSNE